MQEKEKNNTHTDYIFASSAVIAVIFTVLYAFFLFADIGPGFEDSYIALFDIAALLDLTVCIFGFYLALLTIAYFVCSLISSVCGNNDFIDVFSNELNYSCVTVSVIIFIAIAFGFVSWGGL